MIRSRAGFTLVELLVVVLIMAILAAAGVPAYRKTMETSRADDAKSLLQALAGAQQAYYLHHGRTYATGDFPAAPCGATTTGACALVANKYISDRDWGNSPYQFTLCNAAVTATCNGWGSGSNLVGATRKAGPPAPYSSWGYRVDLADLDNATDSQFTRKNGDEP